MRILLTGASGLLGSCLAKELGKFAEIVAAGHSRPAQAGNSRIRLDVTDPAAVAGILNAGGFTHVVHPAALRSPEECAANPSRAYLVNSVAVEYLAAACRKNSAKLVYVSTDYVFRGDAPPYREDSAPAPVNIYGRSKLAGEYAARSAIRHLVTRIPILWSKDPEDPKGGQKPFVDAYREGRPFHVEGVLIRHYSLAADVAAAIAFCIERDTTGVVHLSATETQTKADFARCVGKMHGFNPGLVLDAGIPAGTELRPHNPTLDITLYESLGGPRIRGLSETA